MARITELRVRNLRSLADVRLRLGGLTVLIGDNGTGKSSLLEALAILSLALESSFLNRLYERHGGPTELLRAGTRSVALGLTIQDDVAAALHYDLVLTATGGGLEITRETLSRDASPPHDPSGARPRGRARGGGRRASRSHQPGTGTGECRPGAGRRHAWGRVRTSS